MTTTPQDSGWPVSERILRWAARNPERPAIVDGQLTLTYGAFAARVGSLVGRLRAFGVGRDSVVAIYLPRSAELVVAATAVLVAGGGYLALDINQPFDRTRRMLSDSGAKFLVTMSKLWSINGDAGPVPVYLDDPVPAGHPPMAPPAPESDALAYISYTVDSAGDPTGVLIEHAGLTNLVDWYGACHQVGPADRMSQLNSPSTDAFALEVWPCLAHGATLHVVDRRLLAQPDRLADWLGHTGVTLCSAPAPLAEALLDVPWPAAATLRALLVAGDQLTRYPHAGLPFRVYNTYGRTECTVVATSVEVFGAQTGTETPPIGTPIQGITAYVLDADLMPVGDEQPGQLYLTGSGLARGYLGPRARTLARFVPNPFSSVAGARMYATGDLVRRGADGVLHLLGSARVDQEGS
ncbi:MAG TPA: AMP-binding protein [Pseudonocardiaceae bacterium]|nr:AMP-binding protein [Pseudonocardiaceae bacterium]